MTDPPGIQGVLALEAVEWAHGDRDKLTVRVRGRWRRRRPDWRGQATLVIEADGQRHRFPAVPEPPSLSGAPPGGWEMTFTIPAWLAPHLGGRMWLGLGLVMVPLPAPVGPPGAIESEQPEPPAVPGVPEAEPGPEAALADMTIRAQRLERELVQARRELERARREPERLRELLAERDRQRRAAEQRAHAEEALRLELQEALDSSELPASRQPLIEAGELAHAEERVRQLESQLAALRRRVREAESRVEPVAGPRPPSFDLRREFGAATALPPAPERHEPDRIPVAEVERRALDGEHQLIVARAATFGALTHRDPVSAALERVLAEIRAELVELATIAEREHATRLAAEHRVAELERALQERELGSPRASDVVHELRGVLEQARSERAATGSASPATDATTPDRAMGIEAGRFDAALSRLRASAPPEDGEPGARPPVRAWLKDAFSRLTARDPEAAGRLLVGLLPAQGLVHGAPIAYDLVLGEELTIQLTLSEPSASPVIAITDGPRPLSVVAFRASGDHASLARLANAPSARRVLRRGRARVDGRRREVGAMVELVRSPLGLDELYEAGVRLEPELAMRLAASMLRPAWTAGERFTIAHLEGGPTGPATYLNVRRDQPATVTDTPPLGPVATTIACSSEVLLALLAGKPEPAVTISGDAGPLLAVLGWLERAQRG